MILKQIPLEEVVNAVNEDLPDDGSGKVYMLVKVDKLMTIQDLWGASLFVIDVEDMEPEPEPEPQPKKTKAKKNTEPAKPKLDHGKICALFKAGWPPVKIADEMGCSPSTVTYHLQKEGLA